MTSGKARYTGHQQRDHRFSDALKQKLKGYYPNPDEESDPFFGHPADTFVNEILNAAGSATVGLPGADRFLTRQDILAEQRNLLQSLQSTRTKLRSISGDLDRLLGVDADPLGCGDKLDELMPCVEAAEAEIAKLPDQKRARVLQHDIAKEIAVRVLRVLKDYGVSTAATAVPETKHQSPAVEILQLIGDEIRIARSTATWRDIIAEVKRKTPRSTGD